MTSSVAQHTLKIKCPTWPHLEAFCRRKIKAGNRLTVRVPFQPRMGETVTLALELPDGLVIAIDSRVAEVGPAPDGRKSAVRLDVHGLTPAVRGRLDHLIAAAAEPTPAPTRNKPITHPPVSDEPDLPVPLPGDAPIDEIVEPDLIPRAEDVDAAVRPAFEQLAATLATLREAGAHQVLGVRWDAQVDEIRSAYFELVQRFHPDRFARHRSRAMSLLAEEVFIHINRAYDRMRDAAVASGQAIAAGPALLPHRGWLAGFEDLGTFGAGKLPRPEDLAAVRAAPSPQRGDGGPVRVTFSRRTGEVPAIGASSRSTPPAGVSSRSTPPAGVSSRSTPPAGVSSRSTPPAGVSSPTVPLDAASLFDEVEADAESAPLGAAAASDEAAGDLAERLVAEARVKLADGDAHAARDLLVDALRKQPRDRKVRALYHVAQATLLIADGKRVDATSQLEAALAHDSTSVEATAMLERLHQEPGKKGGGLLRRLFK